ncbi:MAG: IclR family transcriptional regulator [Myxococcota bacterium]|nr:IclR family transcriptional regulator [Myxococcota bacterium]
MKKPKGEYAIQTVVNAMRLLETFRDEDELGVTELSRRLALHKNNVFRLLATLEQQGYIEQRADSERYHLGVRSLELGQSFARSHTLVRCAPQLLTELASGTGECAHLGVTRDYEVVHLQGEQTERLLMSGLRVGQRLPIHCTALGKVLLGCSLEEERQAYDREVVAAGLEKRTEATIADGQKLFEELRTVAVQGFSLDLGECAEGLHCVAAPVFDLEGRVVAALSVSGPALRMSQDRLLGELAPMLVSAGERLSRNLGYAT